MLLIFLTLGPLSTFLQIGAVQMAVIDTTQSPNPILIGKETILNEKKFLLSNIEAVQQNRFDRLKSNT